jgi:hypothetical protein
MSKDENFNILTQLEALKLAQYKIEDRQKILKMPPLEAQLIVNRIIDPALLKPDFSRGFEFNTLSLIDDEFED